MPMQKACWRNGESSIKAAPVRLPGHSSGVSTTVVDRMRAEAIRVFDSGSTWRGIDAVFAPRTKAAGVQCRATRAIAEKHAGLAVLDASRRASVLPLHPRRVTALLQKSCLIDDQNSIRAAQLFQHVIAKLIPRRSCIPTSTVQQILHTVWRRLSGPLRQLPAVFPLTAAQQALSIRQTARTRL